MNSGFKYKLEYLLYVIYLCMRIASKNRFSKLVIKRVRYNNTGATLKQDFSIRKADQSPKVITGDSRFSSIKNIGILKEYI